MASKERGGRVGSARLHLERCHIESTVVPPEAEGFAVPSSGERVVSTETEQGRRMIRGETQGEGSDNPPSVREGSGRC